MSTSDEKKAVSAEPPTHLEHIRSFDSADLKAEQHMPSFAAAGVDAETSKYLKDGVVIDEATNRRLLRLLNRRVLPIMVITYFFQTLDKGTLAFSAVMGIREDNHLVGQQYALLGTILYVGILIGEFPVNRLIQIVPLAKLLGCLVICWGVIVLSHIACSSWGGLMTVRALLGFVESGVQPMLMTLTVMYYKREEHPRIISYWYSQQGLQLMFSGLISFGISKIQGGPLAAWKVLFLIVGTATILWGITILVFLPDSPMKAKCWSEEDKSLIIERLRSNELGVQNKTFKWHQVREACTDVFVWLCIVMQISAFIIVNGLATFSNVIVKGLGFTTGQTQLLNLAQGALTIAIFLSSAALATKFKQTILVMIIYCLPSLAGTIVLMAVPVTKSNAPGMLVAFYLAQFFLVTGNLMWSLISRNIAGQTKKVTVLTFMFVAYATGAIIGPQVFQAGDSPRYIPAWIAHLALYGVFIGCAITARLILMRRNVLKRRASQLAEGDDSVIDHSNAFADLTDKENPSFRYDY